MFHMQLPPPYNTTCGAQLLKVDLSDTDTVTVGILILMKRTYNAKKRNLSITGDHIAQYLAKSKMSRHELARLLNVNPASVTRWIADKYPQTPTSTTFLVLIPLLL